jgi:hypothetical protein
MIPVPLLKTLLDHWDDRTAIDWGGLAETYGDACQPFAGLAPADCREMDVWRQQVLVEALGHLGTLQLITAWQLPFLVVKGIAWAATLWGDPMVRSARDLDLVVRVTDLGAWHTHLGASGFVAPRGPMEWLRGRQIVQLHSAASSGHWLDHVQPPWEAFWERAQTVSLGALTVRHPDPADTLMYLAHHQVFRHAFDHDLGWLDLAGWLRWAPPGAVEEASLRAAGTHMSGALAALAWVWRDHWGQPGLAGLPAMPWSVAPWAAFAKRRPGDWRASVGLSLALAQRKERTALLRAAPAALGRWRRWRDV